MTIQFRTSLVALLIFFILSVIGVVAVCWQERGIGDLLDAQILDTAHSIQGHREDSLQRELELKSAILASSPSFVGYVSQALATTDVTDEQIDTASIRDLLEERRGEFGFDVAAVLDQRGRSVVMLGDALRGQLVFSATPLVARVRAGSVQASDLWTYNDRLILVTLSPMLRGDTIEALLLTGIDIDQDFVGAIAKSGHVDVAAIAIAAEGRRIVASTLDAPKNEALLEALSSQPAPFRGENSAETSREFEVALDDGATRATLTSLFRAPTMGLLVSIVPVRQRVVTAGAIRLPMMIAGAATLIVLLAVWMSLRSRLVTPVAGLVELAERVCGGDYEVEARRMGKGAVSRIGDAFNLVLAERRGYKEALEKRQGHS